MLEYEPDQCIFEDSSGSWIDPADSDVLKCPKANSKPDGDGWEPVEPAEETDPWLRPGLADHPYLRRP